MRINQSWLPGLLAAAGPLREGIQSVVAGKAIGPSCVFTYHGTKALPVGCLAAYPCANSHINLPISMLASDLGLLM